MDGVFQVSLKVLWNDFIANFFIFLELVVLFEIYLGMLIFSKIISRFGDIRL